MYLVVGELGWELYMGRDNIAAVYASLLDAGREYRIGDFGTYALNSLRMEKGFRAWGAEVWVAFPIASRHRP